MILSFLLRGLNKKCILRLRILCGFDGPFLTEHPRNLVLLFVEPSRFIILVVHIPFVVVIDKVVFPPFE